MKAAEGSTNVAESARQASVPASGPEAAASAWSALADGAIGDHEWDELWAEPGRSAELLGSWHAYQVVGDALRGDVPLVGATPAPAFLADFQARLRQERLAAPGMASTQEMAVVSGRRHAPAANDTSFRWKMVAMAASVAAVMAVSWSVLGTFSGDGASSAGPQLAEAAPSVQPEVVVAVPEVASPVIVNTGQGLLIRDARLEALLAEHRQYGGMSALQKPAGFLRNATYDTPDR